MKPSLQLLKGLALSDLLIRPAMFFELDAEEALAEREADPFDSKWVHTNTGVESSELDASDKEAVDQIREAAYKATYRATGDSDLSAFVSDDFGLIAVAVAVGHSSAWLNALVNEYSQGRFPRGTLVELPGRLDEFVSKLMA
jgi:hypothetical protein